ncbi:MAG: twin-arginine translocase subunit TatC [Nitrosopumilus sp.]|nr:twin-arginine translocase subunit TatC [Nitrosopumilus sp.]MDA7941459.1 twin-arginine translocase subunit TatC [Nitrosopumilus sp.]MDA7943400.1 twin-arginine translocase subunit TatC [Nitrosopumilus sp.]MDA7945748.1 twin-arginine translocase subunit TatC [Nitrosopumilus sp.]MDA7955564.1 twin-arginine translocase subunit TatC [Nitrosopumilus sp.]
MHELDARGHVEELRRRLLRSVAAAGIATVLLLTIHVEPYDAGWGTIYYPVPNPLDSAAAQITQVIGASLVPDGVQLIQTAPGQAFFAQVHVAALAGVAVAVPVISRELAAFVGPALSGAERGAARRIAAPAAGLFVGGCALAYLAVIPFMLEFLYRYGESAGLVTFLGITDFVAFVVQFMLAFGISFQLPVAMYAASASGLAGPGFWRRNFRYAAVIMVVFGAAITPDGSGVTMWFITGPMIALYAAGMLAAGRKS